tara:strand:- start:8 stop:301 length:294 start_codon:yes stop_codon:yes gene_type:complete
MTLLTIRKRLTGISSRLKMEKEELKVAEEQLTHLNDEASDAHMRALLSETALSDREYREADNQARAMEAHFEKIHNNILRLESQQDELLDQLNLEKN